MRAILDEATDPWGIKVNRVELKNILPPQDIQNSMEKQMKAERDRRQAILQAEGAKRSADSRCRGRKGSRNSEARTRKSRQQSCVRRGQKRNPPFSAPTAKRRQSVRCSRRLPILWRC